LLLLSRPVNVPTYRASRFESGTVLSQILESAFHAAGEDSEAEKRE